MLSRRKAILGGASAVAALANGTFGLNLVHAAPANAAAGRRSRRVPFGACVNVGPLQKDPEYRAAFAAYCQQLVPEGGMYWYDLRPNRDQFNFDIADTILTFADANELPMRGHTLVWHGAMPEWTKQISGATEAERELTIHIERVVSRYRGKIRTWHVVNEPIDDPVAGKLVGLRPSLWLQNLGSKYIDLAFRLAHQIDPSAELVLNEFGVETTGADAEAKRPALLALVRDLLARGVPLHGVGLQGHLTGKAEIDRDRLSQLVSEFRSLGLSLHVTEFDVADDDLPASPIVRDAVVAARAYDLLDAVFAAARPAAVLTWGITDRYTWIPMWHKRADGLINRPLPLDQNYRPKPLWSVIDHFCGQAA